MSNQKQYACFILHGWGADSTKLEPLKDLLLSELKSAQVELLHLPGFEDQLDKPWNVDDYANWLMDKIKDKEHVVLIGHSFGGQVIAKMLSTHALANVDAAVFISAAAVRRPVTVRQHLRKTFSQLAHFFSAVPFLSSVKGFVRAPDYQKATPMMRETMQLALADDVTPILPHLTTPSLLLWGEDDQQTPLAQAQIMARTMPNATLLTLPDKKHDLPYKEPAWIASQVSQFLSTIG